MDKPLPLPEVEEISVTEFVEELFNGRDNSYSTLLHIQTQILKPACLMHSPCVNVDS